MGQSQKGVILPLSSGDKRKFKYLQELLRKHDFWDHQPTLRDDMEQKAGPV